MSCVKNILNGAGEIEERIADFKAEHGREPTPAEIHVIAKKIRRRRPTRPSLCLLSGIIWRNAGRPSANMI